MCLTIPGKIKSIKEGIAQVENGSRTAQIDLGLCLDAKVGDWVLYATDRAVKLISEEDARDIISLLEDHYHPVDVSRLPLEFKRIIVKVRSRQSVKRKTQNNSSLSETGPFDGENAVISTPQELRVEKSLGRQKISRLPLVARDDKAGDEVLCFAQDDSRKNNNLTIQQFNNSILTKEEIVYLLKLKGKDNLETLFAEANSLRKEMIEDFVCIHGIIEFSNYCKNNCLYCGIRKDNRTLKRYRLAQEEIIDATINAVEKEGYKLIVLQSGEDGAISDDFLLETIKKIKAKSKVFIFLSVGERSPEFYKNAKAVGASGSLMRFETSNPALYEKLRPGHKLEDRIKNIECQKDLGYYIATGNMVGLPGQTIEDIADDLLMIQRLNIPMISSGPFIPSSGTPLEESQKEKGKRKKDGEHSVLGSNLSSQFSVLSSEERVEMFLKYIAIARFMMPEIKIPVTTALETLDPENGRHRGLLAGANALMFNLTPEKYCKDYNIYDNKYREREKVWQKYGLFQGEESWEMLENRLSIF